MIPNEFLRTFFYFFTKKLFDTSKKYIRRAKLNGFPVGSLKKERKKVN